MTGGFLGYTVQRVLLLALTVLGILTITFVISRVLPGSPVDLMLGSKPTPDQIEEARRSLGLDRPLLEQYVRYIGDILQGDWGQSLRTGQPVLGDLGRLMPATLELVTLALLLAVGLGVPLGVRAAVCEGQAEDYVFRVSAIAGAAIPAFVLGIILQVVFHGALGILPLQGRIDANVVLDAPFASVTGFYLIDTVLAGQWAAFASALSHLVLPLTTLTISAMPIVFRVTRNIMADVLGADHVRTMYAYGMPEGRIHYRYALRATLIPLLTVIGLTYGYMIGGSIIVEYVFDWPGIGGYVVNGVIVNDFPAVLGVTVVLAASYLTINLIVDLGYHALDPRLRKA